MFKMKAIDYIVLLVFLMLAGIANSQMDLIRFRPDDAWFSSDWWMATGAFAPQYRSWLTKNILSFCSDGWHFLKTVQIFSYSFIISYFINKELAVHCRLIGAVIVYAIIGVLFELGYNFLRG